jgi:hypothetical protein
MGLIAWRAKAELYRNVNEALVILQAIEVYRQAVLPTSSSLFGLNVNVSMHRTTDFGGSLHAETCWYW